jgi:Methyltransferase domain
MTTGTMRTDTNALPTYRGVPTIRQDWERFYVQFPDLYDRFTVTTDDAVAEIDRLVGLSGRSTRGLARLARHVTGVEPLAAARSYAASRCEAEGIGNVRFIEGSTDSFPDFAGERFDLAVSIHAAPFFAEDDEAANRAELHSLLGVLGRILAPGAAIVFAGTRPQRHSDTWAPHADVERLARRDRILSAAGFEVHDRPIEADFGTVEEALATCGLIYGEPAIDYLLDGGAPVLPLTLRSARGSEVPGCRRVDARRVGRARRRPSLPGPLTYSLYGAPWSGANSPCRSRRKAKWSRACQSTFSASQARSITRPSGHVAWRAHCAGSSALKSS